MERNGMDVHQVKIFQYLAIAGQWHSVDEIAAGAGVAPRAARAQLARLVDLGLIDQDQEYQAHRYRLSSFAGKRNRPYLQRMEEAASALTAAAD